MERLTKARKEHSPWFILLAIVTVALVAMATTAVAHWVGWPEHADHGKSIAPAPHTAQVISFPVPSTTHVATLMDVSGGGFSVGCGLASFPFPHSYCHIDASPNEVANVDWNLHVKIFQGVTGDRLVSYMTGLLCAPLGLIPGLSFALVFACGVLIDLTSLQIIAAFDQANHQQDCAVVGFDDTPPLPPYDLYARAHGGAHWAAPIPNPNPFARVLDPFIAQWQRNDGCGVDLWNSGSWWAWYHHCGDAINAPGGPYPGYLRNAPDLSETCANVSGGGGIFAVQPKQPAL